MPPTLSHNVVSRKTRPPHPSIKESLVAFLPLLLPLPFPFLLPLPLLLLPPPSMPACNRVSHSGTCTFLIQETERCLHLNEQTPRLHLSLSVTQSPVHCSTIVQGVQYSSVARAGKTLLVAAEGQVQLVLGKGGEGLPKIYSTSPGLGKLLPG